MVPQLLRWMRIRPQRPKLRRVKHAFTPLDISGMVGPRTLRACQTMHQAGRYGTSKFHGRPSSNAGVRVGQIVSIPLAYLRSVSYWQSESSLVDVVCQCHSLCKIWCQSEVNCRRGNRSKSSLLAGLTSCKQPRTAIG
jgi:hypothetical protein